MKVWARVAALSFGGPAGQIAVMHRIIVEEKKWIGEQRFLQALNYCTLLPGPEAQQLATYIGWLMHRTAGGLLAGTLFVLPGLARHHGAVLGLCAAGQGQLVQGLFFGLKAAVLVIVIEAVLRVGRRALRNNAMRAAGGRGLHRDLLLRRAVSADRRRGGLIGFVGHEARPVGVPGRRPWRGGGRSEFDDAQSLLGEATPDARQAQSRLVAVDRRALPGAVAGAGRRCSGSSAAPTMSSRRSRCSSARWRW